MKKINNGKKEIKFVHVDWGSYETIYMTTLTEAKFKAVYESYNKMYGENVYMGTFDDYVREMHLDKHIAPIGIDFRIGAE